ncbi:hypothetical protein [Nocardia sp. NBC_00511]|uniref:hypothetical protein n=1 Tax=Nocardia sp. NBC_00511 TaxID=2903591 RepID=UPI0030E05E4C
MCITFAELHQIASETLQFSDWGRLADASAWIEIQYLEQLILFAGSVAETTGVHLRHLTRGTQHYGESLMVYRLPRLIITGDAVTADGRQWPDERPAY